MTDYEEYFKHRSTGQYFKRKLIEGFVLWFKLKTDDNYTRHWLLMSGIDDKHMLYTLDIEQITKQQLFIELL